MEAEEGGFNMPIDPNIVLSAVQAQRSGQSPFTRLQDVIQLQSLLSQQEQRKQANVQAQQAAEKQQNITDIFRQNIQPTETGIQTDQGPLLQQLAQIDPQAALKLQEGFQDRASKQKLAQEQEREQIAKADTATLKLASENTSITGSAAGAVLNAPPEQRQAVLDNQIDRLIDRGIISTEMLQAGNIPLDVSPESLSVLEGIRQSSLTSQQQIDNELNDREFELKKGDTEKERRSNVDKEVRDLQKQTFAQTSNLRKEFSKLSGDFVKQRDAIDRIVASAKDPSPAGDLALIFNFMKVQDPTSTVRESEFRTAKDAKAALEAAKEGGGIVPAFIMGGINRLLTGEMLLSNQREDFVSRSHKLFSAAEKNNKALKKQFTSIAKKNKLDPDQVIIEFGAGSTQFKTIKEAEAAGLPKGTEITIGGRRAIVE